jgi:anti-sigma factor ChrR (cupin superfamily)
LDLNSDFNQRVVLVAGDATWSFYPAPGVERQVLDRVGGEIGLATSVVRYAPGSRLDRHVHGGGEEILVLEGLFRDEQGEYPAGTWLRNPRWSRHAPFTGTEGALIYVKVGGLAAPFVVPHT